MKSYRTKRIRPTVDGLESRELLSLAVVEVLNNSSYNVNFDFRWSPSSSWTAYSEKPGAGQIFWNSYSTSYQPQVLYNTTTSSGSQTTVNLSQGYTQWYGSGTPPASAATLYDFQNTSTGIQLYYSPPAAVTPTDAVVEVTNNSTYNLTFDLRWTPTSAWTVYSLAPKASHVYSTAYSTGLSPQIYYNTTTASNSGYTVNLSQEFGQWTGYGTPPASSAAQYVYQNTATGVTLYYGGSGPPSSPTAASNPSTSPNWSGYVAETNLNAPASNSVSAVYGTWQVPTVTGPSRGTVDSSVWVGIDGYGGSTVEQTGTEEIVVNGVPTYRAWWEMYSSITKQSEQIITGMTISPGDTITAAVQYIASGSYAGMFMLSINDSSHPNDSFTTYQQSSQTQNPQAQRSSAEWIVEAPGISGSISSVANFGRVNFSNASAVINGVSGPINSPSWQSTAVNLVQNTKTVGSTSILANSGESFTVVYKAPTANIITSGVNLGPITEKTGGDRPAGVLIGGQSSASRAAKVVVGQANPGSVGSRLRPAQAIQHLTVMV